MKLRASPELMLVLCTVIWGGTFPAVKYALDYTSPWFIVLIRFALAGIFFVFLPGRSVSALSARVLLHGILLGFCFFAGFGLQTLGLQTTSSSRSAFLTETLLFFIPVLSFLMSRKLPTRFTLLGGALVVAGLYLLTSPRGFVDWNRGDWLTLGCALAFSLYIIGVDYWSSPGSRGWISVVQSFTVALLALPCVFMEGPRLVMHPPLFLALAYLVIPGTVIVVMLQMRYQPQSTPSRAGIIFALEPVFAMLYAVLLSLEELSGRAVSGAIVVTIGVIFSETGKNAWQRIRGRAP